MKKLIVSVLVVCVALGMLVSFVPASSASYGIFSYHRKLPRACFEWGIDKWGRLVLDASCSTGRIQEYEWQIRDYTKDWNYRNIVDYGYGCIYRTYLPLGRYEVILRVLDFKGRIDSTSRLVVIPERVCRERPREEVEVTLEVGFTKEVTKEEVIFWFIIMVLCALAAS